MRRVIPFALLATLALAGPSSGCGNGDDNYVPPPAPSRPAARAQERAEPESSVQSRVAALVEANERALPQADMRDPFMQPMPERGLNRLAGAGAQVAPDCDTEQHPLGKTTLENLYLMGLVTGTPVPRAMFSIPSSNQAVIVTEGALAGPDCSNRLTDIRDNEAVFEQVTMNEAERSRTVITLRDQRIPQRFLEIETESETE